MEGIWAEHIRKCMLYSNTYVCTCVHTHIGMYVHTHTKIQRFMGVHVSILTHSQTHKAQRLGRRGGR